MSRNVHAKHGTEHLASNWSVHGAVQDQIVEPLLQMCSLFVLLSCLMAPQLFSFIFLSAVAFSAGCPAKLV